MLVPAIAALAAVVALPQESSCRPGLWQAYGAPVESNVPFGTVEGRAIEVADLGRGEELWVGGLLRYQGSFGLVRWRAGHGWDQPSGGSNDLVFDLLAADLGAGLKLYATGLFTTIGGVSAREIAAWDGGTWSPLGVGMDGGGYALAVHDDGSGTALYVGGAMSTVGGLPTDGIARWDGTSWSALGDGIDGVVSALVVHDDGTGSALYAGGEFALPDAPDEVIAAARWNGVVWQAVGTLDGVLELLTVHDFGAGPRLVGARNPWGDAASVAVWDGVLWSPLIDPGGAVPPPSAPVAMASIDDGTGPRLWVGSADAPGVRSWAAGTWHAHDVYGWPYDLVTRGPPGEQRLLATGNFASLDGVWTPAVAVRSPCGVSDFVKSAAGCGAGAHLGAHADSAVIEKALALGVRALDAGAFTHVALFVAHALWPGAASGGCGLFLAGGGELLLHPGADLVQFGTSPLQHAYSNPLFDDLLATLAVPIPNDSALVGHVVVFQALIIDGDSGRAASSNALAIAVTH